jgi:hypothetical protein
MRTQRGREGRVRGETRYNDEDVPVYHTCVHVKHRSVLRAGSGLLDMSTSTSSNSDQRRAAKEAVDVSVLRDIARNSLVHALNSVSPFPVTLS